MLGSYVPRKLLAKQDLENIYIVQNLKSYGEKYIMFQYFYRHLDKDTIHRIKKRTDLIDAQSLGPFLSFKEQFYDDRTASFCVIHEYIEGFSLEQEIKKRIEKSKKFAEEEIMMIIEQISKSGPDCIRNGLHLNLSSILISIDKESKKINKIKIMPDISEDKEISEKILVRILGKIIQLCMISELFKSFEFKKDSYLWDYISSKYSQKLVFLTRAMLSRNTSLVPKFDSILSLSMFRSESKVEIDPQSSKQKFKIRRTYDPSKLSSLKQRSLSTLPQTLETKKHQRSESELHHISPTPFKTPLIKNGMLITTHLSPVQKQQKYTVFKHPSLFKKNKRALFGSYR